MQYHGFKDVVDYKLADGFSDSDFSVEAYTDDDIILQRKELEPLSICMSTQN